MLEGLPPNNAAYRMRVRCDQATARAIADLVVETLDPADTAATAFEEATNTRSWKDGLWIVEIYFGHAPDEASLRGLIAAVAGEALAAQVVFGRVRECDWVAASLAGLKPVRAGRFLVHGAHDRAEVNVNDIAIEIEAALAFGTGHHGSTRGCLLMLQKIARRRRPRAILDVGTGTGILAIAAARLFKRKVAAGDIDAVSVAAARANARLNRAGAYVRPVIARGVAHRALRAGAPYDLVFGNILARPLRAMAPSLARLMAPGAELVLSGLLAGDVAGVVAAYRAQGLALQARLDIDGWATLLLRRGQRNSSARGSTRRSAETPL